jgi:ABC-type branched-subunit amino acid transport system substrate-binding protein
VTSSSTPTTQAPTTTAAPPDDGIVIDEVTVTDDTIYLGILADLTGPFSGNVVDLIDAQLAFWAATNEQGGIAGRNVELLITDTGYRIDDHRANYESLRDKVVMFSHSTGSPHTASIAADLAADDLVAIPVSWYSGWADPQLGANVLETGSSYCIEAMNTLSFIAASHEAQTGVLPTMAIATDPGDYGEDSAAGARYAAGELGIDIVFDGAGQIRFGEEVSQIGAAIAQSGADYVWLATDPLSMAELVSTSLVLGYDGAWSGSMPTFSPRLLDTALGPYLSQAWLLSVLYAPVGADVEGMDEVYRVLAGAFPDRYPSDGLIKGYLEFSVTKQILERAAELGDLTPAGVVAATRETEALFFDGISPANVFTGSLNESAARATAVYQPDIALFEQQGGLSATFSSGAVSPYRELQGFFISDVAANYQFDGPCYTLEG